LLLPKISFNVIVSSFYIVNEYWGNIGFKSGWFLLDDGDKEGTVKFDNMFNF